MSRNSWDSKALAGTRMFLSRVNSSQVIDLEQVERREDAPQNTIGEDFALTAWPNSLGSNEIRSWAVQAGTPFWRNSFSHNEMRMTNSGVDMRKQYTKSESAVRAKFIRWTKFNAVGAIGILVQMAALFLLKSGLHFHYLVATAFAVEVAVIHNFVWHEQFTWLDRVRASARSSWLRLLRFNLTTGGVSIVGNLALMKLLAGMAHMNYFVANGIAIALCSLVNFVASEEWVFEG